MHTISNILSFRKPLICTCAAFVVACVILFVLSTRSEFENRPISYSKAPKLKHTLTKSNVDNSGASDYLVFYDILFGKESERKKGPADPNIPHTIREWWQAAAMIDWYINSPIRQHCKNRVAMGNWHICQDKPYTIQPPCLVYSFGINWDFQFDDAMLNLGCEVHSFDPSMNETDHQRHNGSMFHNLGLGYSNTDAYVPRQDGYVLGKQLWKMRTVKTIMMELGHENRVIDVFKMDVEAYEWAVLDNMMETNVLKYIRQLMLEFHLFPQFPLKEDYVQIYKVATRLREMGFMEFSVGPHPKTLNSESFNNQGDSEFINTMFARKPDWS